MTSSTREIEQALLHPYARAPLCTPLHPSAPLCTPLHRTQLHPLDPLHVRTLALLKQARDGEHVRAKAAQ